MAKTVLTLTGVLVAISALLAQEPRTGFYQVLGPGTGVRTLDEGFNNRVVKGKPFSATEERRSLQILGNGTRIEGNQTNRLFRDSEGRTRVEEMNAVSAPQSGAFGPITIFDPVTGVRTALDPPSRSALSVPAAGNILTRGGLLQPNAGTTKGASETTESLNPQMINGVMAQGVRTTMTIPRGQIGNDREIKVVTERWVSNDLQMLIKSTNSDPRFGETSYQLTGIVEREPDASLFQIPAGYTVNSVAPGGRGGAPGGGRSGAPGGRGRGGVPSPAEPVR